MNVNKIVGRCCQLDGLWTMCRRGEGGRGQLPVQLCRTILLFASVFDMWSTCDAHKQGCHVGREANSITAECDLAFSSDGIAISFGSQNKFNFTDFNCYLCNANGNGVPAFSSQF